MKNLSFTLALCIMFFSCKKDDNTIPAEQQTTFYSQDANWHILKSPDAQPITGVYGNIDQTLVITTGPKIYSTNNMGKSWKEANYNQNKGLFGFAARHDSLFVLNTKRFATNEAQQADMYAMNPSFFSIDMGLNWLENKSGYDYENIKIHLNSVVSKSGITYRINVISLKNESYSETDGIKTSSGKKISLPNEHQIQSLYLDEKSRLYITASAAICGKGDDFKFCGDQNGILYISKAPQP